MSVVGVGLFLLIVMGFILAGGFWIPLALGAVGWIGMAFFTNAPPGLNLATAVWGSSASWTLAALPLFIWMGEILFRTRLSENMFNGLAPWLSWLPGRLMHVNVVGCGIFGAVCGSSAATCATIAKISLPELTRRGYDRSLCLGSLAGSGTLGILIPPSIIMVVYAVAAEVSIIQMFIAGVLPGLLVMGLFSAYIIGWSLANPGKVPPRDPPMSLGQKLYAARELIPCLLLILAVLGSIAFGFATATEAAAFGVLGALLLAGITGALTWATFVDSLMGATRLSCMIMFILAGASFLTVAMGFTGIPQALAAWVGSLNPDRYTLIALLCVLYVLLGCVLDGVSMIVLTTSIVVPMIEKVGIDLVWFGIFIVLVVEIAQITPPVGFNLFVLQNMSRLDGFYIARAALPFFVMLGFAIALLTAFPGIATWLPRLAMAR